MLSKITLLPVLLWMCVSLPSYAYVIGANLTIENQTDVPMQLVVNPPNGQNSILTSLPAHQATVVYVENGDHSGRLYHASVAPFSIKDISGKTEYVNGRVAYYVGAGFWSKYSFLDSVAAGKGISIDQTYSCANGGSGIAFENDLMLSGEPGAPAPPNPDRGMVRCQGLKASKLDHNNEHYFINCSDDRTAKFTRLFPNRECRAGNYEWSPPSDGCYWWTSNRKMTTAINPYVFKAHGLQAALDDGVGGPYCQTFEESL